MPDILGKLSKENIEKTIDSVSYFLAQVDKWPDEFKSEMIKLAKHQAVSLLISLNKLKLLFKNENANTINLSNTEQILLSSLKAQNKLTLEKEMARLEKEGKDVDLQFFMGLRDHIKS